MKKLNFGCGTDLKEGWDNIDIQKSDKVAKSFDFDLFPYPIKDNSYDYIYTRNVLEHLNDPEKTLYELWRIGRNNTEIEIIVPYYGNKGAYSCLNHRHYFNDTAFLAFVNQDKQIDKKQKFEIIELKLIPSKIGIFFPEFIRKKLLEYEPNQTML